MLDEQTAKTAPCLPKFPELKSSNDLRIPDTEAADALVTRAKSLPLTDGGLQTAALLEQALVADPHHHEAQILLERLHQMSVPRWHYPMLADEARNKAYAAAIAATVRPGDIVLDIGCGAGLTAMLAARAGAKHVYTCEQQPLIAEAARQVIQDNGLSDQITVISKWSHEIVMGVDMSEPADVVISEIVDTVLLGEGALATLTHAMGALAKPSARAVPERGILKAQLVESPDLMTQWRPKEAEGFDLSAFHRFSKIAQLTPNDMSACSTRAIGPARELFEFDFKRPTLEPGRATQVLTVDKPGIAQAVFLSFEMELAPGIVVRNGLDAKGHWGRTAFLLEEPVFLDAGEHVEVTAQHDASALSLKVHPRLHPVHRVADAPVWMTSGWQFPYTGTAAVASEQIVPQTGPDAPQNIAYH